MISSNTALTIYIIKGKILSIIGYFLELFLLTGVIVYVSTADIIPAIVVIIFMILSSLLVINGRKIKHSIIRFKQYKTLLLNNKITSLDIIALKTSRSIDLVRQDIILMIDKKLLGSAFIDDDNNEIVINELSNDMNNMSKYLSIQNNKEVVTIKCNNCGAVIETYSNNPAKCEYCGSVMKLN